MYAQVNQVICASAVTEIDPKQMNYVQETSCKENATAGATLKGITIPEDWMELKPTQYLKETSTNYRVDTDTTPPNQVNMKYCLF